jgi:hypothetical protein
VTSSPCCANRPPEYPHSQVADLAELAALLVDVSPPDSAHGSFRCRVCGQAWEEYPIPGDGDDFSVVKVGWATDALDSPAARSPAVVPNVPPGPPRPMGVFGGFGILVVGACLFYALWTLPPLAAGRAARYGWVARWIVGGLLAALALQTVLSLLGARRRARRR